MYYFEWIFYTKFSIYFVLQPPDTKVSETPPPPPLKKEKIRHCFSNKTKENDRTRRPELSKLMDILPTLGREEASSTPPQCYDHVETTSICYRQNQLPYVQTTLRSDSVMTVNWTSQDLNVVMVDRFIEIQVWRGVWNY